MPFEVPEGWVWTTLGEVGTWQSGGTPSRSNKTYYGGNIPWLKTGDLNDGLISYIPESITEEAVANSSAKINPRGSVLIAICHFPTQNLLKMLPRISSVLISPMMEPRW